MSPGSVRPSRIAPSTSRRLMVLSGEGGSVHRLAAQDEDRPVVAVRLSRGVLLEHPGEGGIHIGGVAPDLRLQERLQTLEPELLAGGIAGLRDPVGVKAEKLVGLEPDLR